MIRSSHPACWLALLLAGVIALGEPAAPVAAAATPASAGSIAPVSTPAPPALVAGFMDSFMGNRQKMIQFAFIGFAIGVTILMTSTRKH